MHLGSLVLALLGTFLQGVTTPGVRQEGEQVLLRFQVSGERRQLVRDLRPEELEIRVDGVPQKLAVFEGPNSKRTIPLEISFLFDCSRAALGTEGFDPRLFHENLLKQREHAAIAMHTSSQAPAGLATLVGPTRDPAALQKATDSALFVHPMGTMLLDQIRQLAVTSAAPGRAVRMLVVLSDGGRDYGPVPTRFPDERKYYDAAVRAAQGANMEVYTVLLRQRLGVDYGSMDPESGRLGGLDGGRGMSSSGVDANRSIGQFRDLAGATGGEVFEVLGDPLPPLLKSIARLIQDDYVVGFVPAIPAAEKRHRVEIVVRDRKRGRPVKGTRTLVY